MMKGNLSSMARGWTTSEFASKRRLVQFWRRQLGTELHVAFAPLAQEDFVEECIVVSCIYREESDQCFVTSVDAIYLLEALIGSRFSVEEKNRVRRNLEGFKPVTISKMKPGFEDFFTQIMEFPVPKPRNIEKNVKVFAWNSLQPALEKIVGKYVCRHPLFFFRLFR
jgi:hypothetical protein